MPSTTGTPIFSDNSAALIAIRRPAARAPLTVLLAVDRGDGARPPAAGPGDHRDRLAGQGLESTLAMAERLAGHGYDLYPTSLHAWSAGVKNLSRSSPDSAAGITSIFVPGGDAQAVGDYPDALSLLEDLAVLGRPSPM